jgi:Ca2+-binding EF-hand superfamily protein
LNLKEFEFRLTRTEWWNLSRETPEAMFKAADANQNGTLSKKEFAVFQKKEAHLDVFFNRADLDKSGGVDLEEGTKFINNEIFPSRKLKNIRKAKSKGPDR